MNTATATRPVAALPWPALVLVVWLSMPSPAGAQPYAPAFPSDGATLVSENDLVAVWEVTRVSGAGKTASAVLEMRARMCGK